MVRYDRGLTPERDAPLPPFPQLVTSPALNAVLGDLLAELAACDAPEAREAVARASDRIERDLKPRAAGADSCVVAGLVGPNNAGKSALFNALMGNLVSPSEATGGATRRLVGGASPAVCERLIAAGSMQRFQFEARSSSAPVREALDPPVDPSRVVLVPSPSIPPGLLLIDTPDFDSVARDNRKSSEALLAVCDLVIVVVTRHTYQNAEVVSLLRRWLRRGRPWMLVVNEAPSATVAETWVERLSRDLGSAPLASFCAPLDLSVMEGQRPLEPTGLGAHAGLNLATALGRLEELEELKQRALEASLAQLRADLEEIDRLRSERSGAAARLLSELDEEFERVARRIAGGGMPAGPFLAAFRAVLDRRSHPVSRTWRGGLKFLRLRLEALAAKVRPGAAERAAREGVDPKLAQLERDELERAWPGLFSGLERINSAAVGSDGSSLSKAFETLPVDLKEQWDLLIQPGPRPGLLRASDALVQLPWSSDRFQAACEELIDGAIEARGYAWDIQAGADLATVLPMALAAVLVVHTGGFAADVGVAGGGLLTSFLFERYTHVLGSGILRQARQRWEDERSKAIHETLCRAWFAEQLEEWRSLAKDASGGELTRLANALSTAIDPATHSNEVRVDEDDSGSTNQRP